MNNPLLSVSPVRVFGGAEALLLACNQRVVRALPSLRPAHEEPGFLLSRYLGHGAEMAASLYAIRQVGSVLHAYALVRSLFEPALELLWASRNRWPQYWSGSARSTLQLWEARAKTSPRYQELLQGETAKQLRSLTGKNGMPTDFAQLFDAVDRDDNSDPIFGGSGTPPLSAREMYEIMIKCGLHLAAHGDPAMFTWDDSTDRWPFAAAMFLTSTINLCRAAHLQRGWRQDPVFWAYQWITRGQRDPSDGNPTADDSYGDLGLVPGQHHSSILYL